MNGFDEEKYQHLLENVTPATSDYQLQHAMYRVNKNRKRKRVIVQTLVTAAVICFAFVGLVRFSSTFAYAVAKLPGMKPLVEMIAHDKGLEDIVNNEYYEELDVSQTIGDMTLTITGVVADESGMIIYYKLKSEQDIHGSDISPMIDVFQNGQGIKNAGVSYSWSGHDEGTFEVESSIEVVSSDRIDYSSRDFEVIFLLNRESDVKFVIPFTLHNEIKSSKHIVINEEVIVEQQKFTVHELILSPIRSELKLSLIPSNTMKILDFTDILIFDEKGEQWGRQKSGIIGKGSIDEGIYSIMLESNYFRTPKSLTLVFESIEAIPKQDAWITVDWATKEIIHQPETLQLDIELQDEYKVFYSPRQNGGRSYPVVFGEMVDANGTVFEMGGWSYSENENSLQITEHYHVEEPPVNPVKLNVHRYKNYLKEKPRIEIDVK